MTALAPILWAGSGRMIHVIPSGHPKSYPREIRVHQESNDHIANAPGQEPSEQAQPPIITKLAGARVPADHGISSLGLLMQLGGTLGIIFAAFMGVSTAMAGAARHSMGMLFFFATLCGVRSAFHRAAGTALLYGRGSAPRRGVLTYVLVSTVQTTLCLLLLKYQLDLGWSLRLGALFMSWPLVLLFYFSLPQIKTLISNGVPDSEDHGFEGAGVFMALFGLMGILGTGLVLAYALEDISTAFASTQSTIIVLVFVTLLVRSIIHFRAGQKVVSGASFEECNASASRYYNLGIVSAFCIGATAFVVWVLSVYHFGTALLIGAVVMALLLAWPTILRRLYLERNFSVYLAGNDAPTFQRAPDAGLIALGWTLTALGAISLSLALVNALFDTGLDAVSRSSWWSVATSGLQLWAGAELVRMSERHRLAAMIYGIITTAVILYQLWPIIGSAEYIFADMFGQDGTLLIKNILTGTVGLHMILAIGTIVLVNRVTVPSAVAHLRK